MSNAAVDSTARSTANQALRLAKDANNAARNAQNTATTALNKATLNAQEIQRIKQEMAKIESAIHSMSKTLGGKLETLSTQNKLLMAENAAGFAAMTGMTKKVDSSVKGVESSVAKNTSALARMEYLRLYNEAKAPARQINMFSEEIEQRFEQAILNVHINRELYNEHFTRIFEESSNKFMTIGEHIFRVYEEDFKPVAQQIQTQARDYTDEAIELDVTLIEERSRQLDTDLSSLYTESLGPILERHSRFEAELSSQFAVEGKAGSLGKVAVPAAVAFHAEKDAAVVVGGSVKKGEGSPSLASRKRLRDVEDILRSNENVLRERAETREMSAQEIEQVKSKLQEMAQSGVIASDLLPGYLAYLDRFGLAVIDGGDGSAALKVDRPEPAAPIGASAAVPASETASENLVETMRTLHEAGEDAVEVQGLSGTWEAWELSTEDAVIVLPEEETSLHGVLSLPFPNARLRHALGVSVADAEAILRPVYLWNADVLEDSEGEFTALAEANRWTIAVHSELRDRGLYEQAHDDFIGGGVSREVYQEIGEALGLSAEQLQTVPFVEGALSEAELETQRAVAKVLKDRGLYQQMLDLDQNHPESVNDCLSPDVWKEVLAAAGVTGREMLNAWWLGWLDEASEEELDAVDAELSSTSENTGQLDDKRAEFLGTLSEHTNSKDTNEG